jgi:hypothetical protein
MMHVDDSMTTITNTNGDMVIIPNEFICPITLEIMKRPMASRHGHSFERDAILQWIQSGNGYCPLTRSVLTLKDIVPYHSLKLKINQWILQNNIETKQHRTTRSTQSLCCLNSAESLFLKPSKTLFVSDRLQPSSQQHLVHPIHTSATLMELDDVQQNSRMTTMEATSSSRKVVDNVRCNHAMYRILDRAEREGEALMCL